MAAPKITAVGPVLSDQPADATVNYDVGDLVYLTAAVWQLADADANTTYAQGICMSQLPIGSEGGARISVCFEAIIEDVDSAAFTAGAAYYLSTTAGSYSTTRPSAAPDIVQVVGVAKTANILHFKVSPPHEISEYQQFTSYPAYAQTALDSGNYYQMGILNANGEVAALTVRVPDNAISLAEAYLWAAEEAEVSTVVISFDVSSTIDQAQHSAVTADTSFSIDIAGTYDVDEIVRVDCSSAFDATDMIRPGALLGVEATADLGGTDIVFTYGIEFIWRVVGG